MKRSFRTLGILALASGLALTGCQKEIETSNLTLDLTKKATVTAYFYAETDNQTQGLEFAEPGTKVIVSIPNSEFNPAASGNWTDTATIANGKITVSVPATTKGVIVTFYPAEFTKEQTQVFGSNTIKISKIFKLTAGSALAGVKAGETRTHQATYSAGVSFDNFTEKVSMKIELKAIFKEGDASVVLPQNTVINMFTNGWAATATVGEKGIINVNVPKGETIYFQFEATKTLNTVPVTTKKYRYTEEQDAPLASSPVQYTVDFGNGKVWE